MAEHCENNDDFTLYWTSGSPPCWRVMIALEEKNLHPKLKYLDLMTMQHRLDPTVKELNPRQQVPILVHPGNIVICESLAILDFLDHEYPTNSVHKLIPDESHLRVRVTQKSFEAAENLQSKTREVMYTVQPWLPKSARPSVDPLRWETALKDLATELDRWERVCDSNFVVVDYGFSMADAVLFPQLAFLVYFGLDLSQWPNLQKYYNFLGERPSVKKSWPPTWRTFACPEPLMSAVKRSAVIQNGCAPKLNLSTLTTSSEDDDSSSVASASSPRRDAPRDSGHDSD